VLAGAEQHVGAVFELVDDPAVLHSVLSCWSPPNGR
jgi:hypothetical protein